MDTSWVGQKVIVVGIDGSESSRQALRWAAQQAELVGAALHVVQTWHVPSGWMTYVGPNDTVILPAHQLHVQCRAAMETTLDETLGRDRGGLSVRASAVEGGAAEVLLEISEREHAAMLVVGSRGLGGFMGLLIGSVSEQCVSHAKCPVVVVHEPAKVASVSA